MDKFRITGGRRLSGRVQIGGAKNAALPALAACLLTGETVELSNLPGVRDVRVKGAIGVVELERQPNVNALRTDFIAAGVWIRPFGRSVYLMPALNISAGDLTSLTDAIHDVLRRALD